MKMIDILLKGGNSVDASRERKKRQVMDLEHCDDNESLQYRLEVFKTPADTRENALQREFYALKIQLTAV